MRGKYDLRILDRQLNKWIHADIADVDIALNFEVNDIAELKSLKNNWSQAIKLPVTPTNAQLFELAELPNAATNLPYRQLQARLFCDGIRIAGKGTILVFHKITPRYYECQLISGNKDFFNQLKESPFSDLDFGTYRVLKSSLRMANWNGDKTNFPDPQACVMAAVSCIATNTLPPLHIDPDNPGNNALAYPYTAATSGNYPLVRIPAIIRAIEAASNYVIDDSKVAHLYQNDVLSLADVGGKYEGNVEFQSEVVYQGAGIGSIAAAQWDIPQYLGILGNVEFQRSRQVISYTANYKQKIKITFSVNQVGANTNIIGMRKLNDGPNFATLLSGSNNYRGDVIINMNDGDVLLMEIRVTNYKNNMQSRIILSDFNTEPSNIGVSLKLSERLGFSNQLDFISFFAKTYGLIFNVDETHGRVNIFNLQTLYDNRMTAVRTGKRKEWTDKLNKDSHSIEFRLSQYAQTNYIKLDDNEADDVTDRAAITIPDTVITGVEKDLYSLPIQAGKDTYIMYDTGINEPLPMISPVIPLIQLPTGDEYSGSDSNNIPELLRNAKFAKIKPHLITLQSPVVNILVADDMRAVLYQAKHKTAQTLVTECYAALQRMLTKCKIVEAEFALTPFDVQNFDHRVPVYLKPFGKYFYVSKIHNFRAGYLTRVTLMKL